MSGIVLIGEEASRQQYIQSFLQAQHIPSYNIRTFDMTLKISEVRELIRYVSFKDSSNSKRAILINQSITLEAQNALLKTLEELPEDVIVILSADSPEQFLPTILSRCVVKRLNAGYQGMTVENSLSRLLGDLLESVQSHDFQKILNTVLALGEYAEIQDNGYKQIIMALRLMIKDRVDTGDRQAVRSLVHIIEALNSEFWFVEKNNGNSRVVLENRLLSTIVRK